MKRTAVTTSWDDGHKLDLKVLALLRKYGLKGTFYVAPRSREVAPDDRLTDQQIRALAAEAEIGAHTMTHPRISRIPDDRALEEMRESREYLERVTGRPVTSFCYPCGDFSARHEAMAAEAGFTLARTVRRFGPAADANRFALTTTVHAYRHWSDALAILRAVGPGKFLRCYLNWDKLANALFDKACAEGSAFHLWGHSWEIEKNGDWRRLERVFAHIAAASDVRCVINAELP